jgi:tungstate transport system substrate-binding protein
VDEAARGGGEQGRGEQSLYQENGANMSRISHIVVIVVVAHLALVSCMSQPNQSMSPGTNSHPQASTTQLVPPTPTVGQSQAAPPRSESQQRVPAPEASPPSLVAQNRPTTLGSENQQQVPTAEPLPPPPTSSPSPPVRQSDRRQQAPTSPPLPTQQPSSAVVSATSSVVRLATVTTIKDGGLLPELLADFEKQTGLRVEVYVGNDVYGQARAGKADVVFSHLGHRDAQAFMEEGLGQWPRTILFNQLALLVPSTDPAGVRGMTDPVEIFRRIAQTRSPFVVNQSEGLKYVVETLWHAAGRPDKGDWYIDAGLNNEQAAQRAAQRGGYTIWGLTPFLVAQQRSGVDLQPLVPKDPLFQRIMVAIVVNPDKFPGANIEGAAAFQQYLLAPETQARILTFRYPGFDQPMFWPAGRNNASDLLSR